MNYAQIKDKVDQIVKDQAAKIEAADRDSFIQEAVKTYSKHRPRVVIKDITGDGTQYYSLLANLTAWVKGFSVIKSVEYPADQSAPAYLEEEDDFGVYEKEDGQHLRFFSDTPSATEKIRVVYTALHQLSGKAVSGTFSFSSTDNSMNRATGSFLTDGLFHGNKIYTSSAQNPGPFIIQAVTALKVIFFEAIVTEIAAAVNLTVEINTIPESDQEALCNLAASLCSGQLASIYAHASDSTIGADSVDHKSKSQEFNSRAREQYKTYLRQLGLKEGDVAPASAVTDQGMNYPGGLDRLTHPRRQRTKR